jgi:hypothetical protein
MTNHRLTHLSEPKSNGDAVTQKYIDHYLKRDGQGWIKLVRGLGPTCMSKKKLFLLTSVSLSSYIETFRLACN